MLISKDELKNKKWSEPIPLECLQCERTHYRTKNVILRILKGKSVSPQKGCYCSHECKFAARCKKLVVCCGNCNKELLINPYVLRNSKSGKAFCDKSCAAIYNNTHKTHGVRRSKLEVWLEQKLSETYPNLEVHYNRKDSINSELDIYVPSLKLAFELNGIFHYKPIYGNKKLNKIKNNDNRKFQSCLENGIKLCIIDVSNLSHFKEEKAKKILNIISNLIK